MLEEVVAIQLVSSGTGGVGWEGAGVDPTKTTGIENRGGKALQDKEVAAETTPSEQSNKTTNVSSVLCFHLVSRDYLDDSIW